MTLEIANIAQGQIWLPAPYCFTFAADFLENLLISPQS
ncbi:hypothetical protein SFHH103_03426 [Sinorhizobium fredii HH103]|uniref:Uncharacterized protein n=1 Tax=Sinorhizobium fredii (strain HH103) TaxID=1117943 RepID=G9A3H0_SINF1|nr:hypothetical protein SFHH103_03426 [Sinorhizobium fredii HH103]